MSHPLLETCRWSNLRKTETVSCKTQFSPLRAREKKTPTRVKSDCGKEKKSACRPRHLAQTGWGKGKEYVYGRTVANKTKFFTWRAIFPEDKFQLLSIVSTCTTSSASEKEGDHINLQNWPIWKQELHKRGTSIHIKSYLPACSECPDGQTSLARPPYFHWLYPLSFISPLCFTNFLRCRRSKHLWHCLQSSHVSLVTYY